MRILPLILALILGTSFSALHAKTITAKRNGNWNSSSTWKGGSVPDFDDDVIISGYTVTVNSHESCKSLTMDDASFSSTGLNITANGSLTANGIIDITVDAGLFSGSAYIDVLGSLSANGGIVMDNKSNQLLGAPLATIIGGTIQINVGNATTAASLSFTDIYMVNLPALLLAPSDVNIVDLRNGSISISGVVSMGEDETDPIAGYNVLRINDSEDYDGTEKKIYYSSPEHVNIIQGKFEITGEEPDTDYEFIFNGEQNQYLYFTDIEYKDVIIDKPSGIVYVADPLLSAETIRILTVKSNNTLGIVSSIYNIDGLANPGTFVLESNAKLQISENGFSRGIPSKAASTIADDAIVEYLVSESFTDEILLESFNYPIVQLTGKGTKLFNENAVSVDNNSTTIERIELLEGTWEIEPNLTLNLNTAGAEGNIFLDSATTLNLNGAFSELDAFWDIDRDNTFAYNQSGTQEILSIYKKDGSNAPYGILALTSKSGLAASKQLPNSTEIEIANNLAIAANISFSLENASSLTLLSDKTYTAFVSTIPSSASISYNGETPGKFIVQKYLPLPYRAYRDITSPIQGTTLESWLDKGVIMKGFPGSTTPSAGRVTVTRYNETLQGNLNIGFENANNSTNPIRTEVNSNITSSVFRIYDGNNSDLDYAVTLADEGEIYQGDQDFQITFTPTEGGGEYSRTYDDGWNNLGNPYPAVLDWDAVVTDPDNIDLVQTGKITPTVYVISQIDRHLADPNNPGYYGFYNASTGFKIIHDNLIPSYQGFWVKAYNDTETAATYDLKIKESHKSNAENSLFYKNNLRNGHKAIDATTDAVAITISQNGRGKEKIWFHHWPEAKLNKDTLLDVAKFGVPAESAVSIDFADQNNNFNLWVNALPDNVSKFELPLYVQLPKAAEYTLDFSNLEVFLQRYGCSYLHDTETGLAYNLSLDSSYTFTTTEPYSGNRFTLIFNQNISGKITPEDATCFGEKGKINFDLTQISDEIYYTIQNLTTGNIDEIIQGNNLGEFIVELNPSKYLITNENGLITCTSPAMLVDIKEPLPIKSNFASESTNIEQFQTIEFENQSENATHYFWQFEDDGSFTDEINPSHTFNFPGEYLVSLTAFNADSSCQNTYEQTYNIEEAATSINKFEDAGYSISNTNGTYCITGLRAGDQWILNILAYNGQQLDHTTGKGEIKFNLPTTNSVFIVTVKINNIDYSFKLSNE